MQVVYVDILFLINLIMDGCIFWISAILINKELPLKKLIIGSSIAAILYCSILYLPFTKKIPHFLMAIVIPIIPILYLFKPLCIKEFLKLFAVCNIAAFIIGGASFNLYYYIQPYLQENPYVSAVIPVTSGVLVSGIIYMSFQFIRKRLIMPKFEYDITIVYKGKKIKVRSIVDTGNCLYTLFQHKAVTVVTYESIQEIIPAEYQYLYRYSGTSKLIKVLEDNKVNMTKLYLIPFRSIGCEDGTLLGMEVESISFSRGDKCCHFKNCVIGVSNQKVFADNSYAALLHPDFIQ